MSELSSAIKQICEEKNLDYDLVVSAIELALAAAYRKDFGEKNQNIKVEFDPKTGKSKVFDVKTVVEDFSEEELQKLEELKEKQQAALEASRDNASKEGKPKTDLAERKIKEDSTEEEEIRKFNPRTEIQLSEAKILKSDAKIDEEIVTDLPVPENYGRMAAQTAKQVIVQKLREIERDMIFSEFKDKEREVVSGVVQRREPRFVLVDLGKASGYLPYEEQVAGEKYNPGERVKVYIKEVRLGHKGAEIILSRKSEEILKKVFYLEIPEISNGLIEIKGVAREAGSRSKVAIYTEAENVDPVGSCVGQRGARIQTIINELGGEKVDIIEYNEDYSKFIANSLSPAQILEIKLNEAERKAVVKVAPDKLSLAIGKNGQNVRLAARLTGWKIDIISEEVKGEAQEEAVQASADPEDLVAKEEKEVDTESKEDVTVEEKVEISEKKDKETEKVKKEDKEDKDKTDKKDKKETKKETKKEEKESKTKEKKK
ncbi:MAG: transcription termination factor NusA [Candidatus Pacebacteria bacterium]|nr:transcription termination factor NusA [Candidatus Paceibacterota bacterium]